jgi:sarcosine oxidase subunit delta
MRIPCPLCGARPLDEFSYKGDATVCRPAPDASLDAWHDYVYIRDNPEGRHREFWRHDSGCGAWLVIERDTATHEIFAARLARDVAQEGTAGEQAP